LLKPLRVESLAQQQPMQQPAINAPEILAFFQTIFRGDVRFRVIVVLSKREGACLSEISRKVGMSRKNLAKYLDTMIQSGIVEAYSVGMRDNVYRLATKYSYLRQFL